MGFPIRKSTDLRLLGSSPWLIAACYVLHRLLVPRYPPLALSSLDIKRENPRRHARYAVLKVLEEVETPDMVFRRAAPSRLDSVPGIRMSDLEFVTPAALRREAVASTLDRALIEYRVVSRSTESWDAPA